MDPAKDCAIPAGPGRMFAVEVRATSPLEGGIVARALAERLGPAVRVRSAGDDVDVSAGPVDVFVDLGHVGPDVVVSMSHSGAQTGSLDLLAGSVRLDQLVRLLQRATGAVVPAIGTPPGDGRPKARATGSLTDRELEVLQQMRRGHRNKVIAANLGISVHTVRSHVESIMKKTGTRTRLKAVTAVT